MTFIALLASAWPFILAAIGGLLGLGGLAYGKIKHAQTSTAVAEKETAQAKVDTAQAVTDYHKQDAANARADASAAVQVATDAKADAEGARAEMNALAALTLDQSKAKMESDYGRP